MKSLQPRRVGVFLAFSVAKKKGGSGTFLLKANNPFCKTSFAPEKRLLYDTVEYELGFFFGVSW